MVNNIISEKTHIRGELSLSGVLRIEGVLEGIVYNQGKVYISKSGRVLADIHAKRGRRRGDDAGKYFCRK